MLSVAGLVGQLSSFDESALQSVGWIDHPLVIDTCQLPDQVNSLTLSFVQR